MERWSDEGVILSSLPHGETSAVLEVMTAHHGRSRGYVKGGSSRRQRSALQPGNYIAVTWSARLAENLGRFDCDLIASPLGDIIHDGGRMAALSAVLATLSASLSENEPHGDVFTALEAVIALIAESTSPVEWAAALVKLELGLLASTGYGLDLTRCAATGQTGDLVFVSPKTGRAVSHAAGLPWQEKLLQLPAFLSPAGGAVDLKAALMGLRLTGHFLAAELWVARKSGGPAARDRFIAWLQRRAAP